MKTLIGSIAAVSVIAGLITASGCAKKNAGTAGQGQSQDVATQGSSHGASQEQAAPAGEARVGNTPSEQVAKATGQAAIGKPLVPGGAAPEIAKINSGAVIPVPGSEPAKPVAPPEPDCFRQVFHHDPVSSHSSDEICSQHQNLLVLKHSNVHSDSLCVRVNGRPVRFDRVKGHPEQIIIGPIAGPKAEITARYCVGTVRCQEECKIPKDEFLDALGGTEEVGGQLGKWLDNDEDSGDKIAAQLDSQLKKELAELEGKGELFRGWKGDSEARECGLRGVAKVAEPKAKKAAALKRK